MKTVASLSVSRRRLLGGALLAAFVPLIGCNNASSGKTNAGSNAPIPVRIAFFPNLTHAAALYGTGTGAFQKAFGKTATIKEVVFTAGPSEIEALFAGEVDLGYIGPGPALNGYLKSKGDALKIVAGAASGGVSLVSRADVSIKTVADLAGKTVAAPQKGGTQDLSLRHAIAEAGLKPKEKGGTVTVVEFAPADILTQFQRKTIDAAWIPEPWVTRLEKEAGAKIVVDERERWKNGSFSTAVVIVRSAFLKEHPDLVATFVAAHKAIVAEIAADPDAARKVIGERIKTLNSGKAIPDEVLKIALSRTEITADPLQESVLTFADWSHETGYIREDRAALSGLFADIPAPVSTGSAGGTK